MKKTMAIAALFVFIAAGAAWAGPYGDALGKCLVQSSTPADKTVLVRWMFAMMSLHPDVQASSAVTAEQRTEISKQTARLFQKLLTETCVTEAKEAVRYEGQGTIESSFSILGQAAARELFTNPRVGEGLSEFSKFVDEKRINEILQPEPRK